MQVRQDKDESLLIALFSNYIISQARK